MIKKVAIVTIILISAFLRLYKIDGYMEFLGDQGRDVDIVRNFLVYKNLMFIGPQTSIGNMYLGPWYYYLIAPSLLLANFNPLGPAIFVALLGVLTTYLIYIVGKSLFNEPTGFIASFLYAISPVAIKYNQFSWNPNIMPFASIIFVYFFYKFVTTQQLKHLLISVLGLVLVLNSHYLGLLLLPLIPIIVLLYTPKQKLTLNNYIKPFLIFIFVLFLSILPLILFDIKHQGQNISSIIKFFSVRQETVNLKPYKAIPNIIPQAAEITERLVSGKETHTGLYSFIFITVSSLLFYIKTKSKSYLLTASWFGIGVLGLSLYKQHIYDHYYGFLSPSIFLLAGSGLSFLFSQKNKIFSLFSLAILLTFTYFCLKNTHLTTAPNNQLATMQTIATQIKERSNGIPFNFALLAKQNYDPPYRYFLKLYNTRLVDISTVKTDLLFVACEQKPEDCKVLGNPEYNVAAFSIAKIDTTWVTNGISLYQLSRVK